jgi:hypothetical protein
VMGEDIESEMYRVGGFIAGLTGMEKDREAPGVNPGVWFLAVASIAEIVRSTALEAYADWWDFETSWDDESPGVEIVEQVKDAVLDAINSADSDRGSGAGGDA